MRKSKFVFLILFVVYTFMAIIYPCNVLNISNNLLLALSVTALLISLSDVCEKIAHYCNISNLYYAALKITIDFLDLKISSGQSYNTIINVRNLKANLESSQKKNYIFCHPTDYGNKKIINCLDILSHIFFIIGISSFIIVPFLKNDISTIANTSIITISAFAAMNLSMYFDEIIFGKQTDYNNFINDKQLIIQNAFTDFQNHFNTHMYYRNDLSDKQNEDSGINTNK